MAGLIILSQREDFVVHHWMGKGSSKTNKLMLF
jgi:hypothetical protein